MTLRELVPGESDDDARIFVEAFLAIWNHPENLPFLSFTGRSFDEAQVRGWCREHMSSGVRYFAELLEQETAVGILASRANPLEGYELFSLGVSPGAKRRGIGRRLVRHAIDIAKEAHFLAADADVFANNAPMLCLLLQEGFLPVRIDHHRGPRGEDLVHLKRLLG
jgi:ribosomal protein S18 acetylase RimI-like enzyme